MPSMTTTISSPSMVTVAGTKGQFQPRTQLVYKPITVRPLAIKKNRKPVESNNKPRINVDSSLNPSAISRPNGPTSSTSLNHPYPGPQRTTRYHHSRTPSEVAVRKVKKEVAEDAARAARTYRL
ncbi:hypothetical protein ABKN59_006513 [Abortiporus biennis]